jgi:hypothetical protein
LLAEASNNADKAYSLVFSEKYSHIPDVEKSIWASAAIIHCDICRLTLAINDTNGLWVARLLTVGDIASKLYEARNWYANTAKSFLIQFASTHQEVDNEAVLNKINLLFKKHRPYRIENYKNYRNKVGFHYDSKLLTYFKEFGDLDAEEFFDILESFVQFSHDWHELTKQLLEQVYGKRN